MGLNLDIYMKTQMKTTFDALTLGEQDTFIKTVEATLEEMKQVYAHNKSLGYIGLGNGASADGEHTALLVQYMPPKEPKG